MIYDLSKKGWVVLVWAVYIKQSDISITGLFNKTATRIWILFDQIKAKDIIK